MGAGNCWWRLGRETKTDQGVELGGSQDSRGAGGCMVCRVAIVSARGTRDLVGAGAVEPSGRAAAATVGTVEAPRAIGCGTGGATEVARLAGAGCCRAVGAA